MVWLSPVRMDCRGKRISPRTTLRFGSLKKFFTELNLPGRVLKIGAALLAFNVALPLLYRHFGETKVSIHIATAPAR